MDLSTLEVKIISPRRLIFQGPATSVSSKNSVGDFDILPEHANFIGLVENQTIVIRKPDKTSQTFSFPLAIIYQSQNKVIIYTDIQTR
jgi:F0F1-type ATP synthase epsilon subunit